MSNSSVASNLLGPVMTLDSAGLWLGVRIEQLDRVIAATRLWPVPLSRPEYLGLFDSGQELVPVMQLSSAEAVGVGWHGAAGEELLVAVLLVRGEPVGLVINRAGQLQQNFAVDESDADVPEVLAGVGAQLAHGAGGDFWLVDTDRLWNPGAPGAPGGNPAVESGSGHANSNAAALRFG